MVRDGGSRKGYFAIMGVGFALILLSIFAIYAINVMPVEPNVYGRALVGVVSVMSFATAVGGVLAILMAWVLYVTVGSLTKFYLAAREEPESEEGTEEET